MKRNAIKILASAMVVLGIATGCEKSLDKAPFNAITDDVAFATADRCLLAMNGVYDAAQSSPYTDGSVRGYPFGAANIEQGDARGEDIINVAAFFQITYQATYNATTANNVGMWGALYALINKANISIDGFRIAGTNGVITDAVAKQYEAECRFLRAMAHHEAVILYARPYLDGNGNKLGVPYRDFAINSGSAVDQIKTIARPTVAENYAKILEDLEFAEANLPNTISPATVRASKAAAIALKMRVKLHMGDWPGVITEGAKLVPNTAPFVSPIGGWTLTATPNGPFTNNSSVESIFSIRNDALDNTGTNGALPSMYGAANLGARGLIAVSPIIWNNGGWLCDDIRRTSLYTTGVNANGASTFNYFTTKYSRYTTREDFAPQIRYAEVLLMLAEAEARQAAGVSTRAISLLNAVRNRALANPTTQQYTAASFATKVDLVRAILLERRIEFLCEGKRWGDIHRNVMDANYTTSGIPAKYQNASQGASIYSCGGAINATQAAVPYADFKFVWPIPASEVVQNPIIEQNPDY
ncbi:RagB/SusD family nutrient uptake outer membrane protein [Parasegetibacter sp. NRK P23]|uniref:RagB/SusD family nutrient uptake outer membrane protein n=1 Tax=Parasegetibacter sp. NRK P23 TaxID=2942999 RepID=UPI00204360F1|nr:RagB/SusD family nutrient uptake outer membrane protein [Parasegetibacter sp. NRK P23]MCM5529509.1 RagB/SusD family nutrient uptake outer membrane protein [Parasegetibacter sp. NRK P23]